MVANTNLLRANHGATWVAAASMILIAGTPGWSQSGRGNVPASSAAYEQPLRPQFHWTPKTDYTNDPNGLFYYKGEYHLFYQAREFSDLDTPEWGHAVSTDLVHWTQLPVAIPKVPGVTFEQGYGKRICSGSAVVDWNNTSGFGTKDNPPLVAMYTDPCIDGTYAWQAQSIAYSVDNGRTWTKYAGNPVIDIKARGFRDPKVIWYEPAKRWIAPIAYPDKGVVALYASPNLKEWTHINDFNSGGAECPDLFPMKDDAGKTKWVMTVASGNYWVGEFDGDCVGELVGGHVEDAKLWRRAFECDCANYSSLVSGGEEERLLWLLGHYRDHHRNQKQDEQFDSHNTPCPQIAQITPIDLIICVICG